ncbi:hypothetical protein [Streptomyces sp. NBC_01304]|uniref:hypothetical protein n=1 Tax=Streptomyces sp. NBC_01304 TaxID=2903818 RepID=UPI002E0E668B|nr:hypothetical protein OG430_32130 [Streptomyces sp. NBC_01304]
MPVRPRIRMSAVLAGTVLAAALTAASPAGAAAGAVAAPCTGWTMTSPAAGATFAVGAALRIGIARQASAPQKTLTKVDLYKAVPGGTPTLVTTVWQGSQPVTATFTLAGKVPAGLAGRYLYRATAGNCTVEGKAFTVA